MAVCWLVLHVRVCSSLLVFVCVRCRVRLFVSLCVHRCVLQLHAGGGCGWQAEVRRRVTRGRERGEAEAEVQRIRAVQTEGRRRHGERTGGIRIQTGRWRRREGRDRKRRNRDRIWQGERKAVEAGKGKIGSRM